MGLNYRSCLTTQARFREHSYSSRPSRGIGTGSLAFHCFDVADGDPELAPLLAVTAVRLGYELLPDACHPTAESRQAPAVARRVEVPSRSSSSSSER
jgi:hypothetical protein